jgi:predicted Fe-Mo cluster-binding NifX family protein
MTVCFPVTEARGLQSKVYGHFGSAPAFLLVDTESRVVKKIDNRDLHHAHGACSPLKALGPHGVDAVVVGGIGRGALMGLASAGVKVYRASAPTAAGNLEMLRELEEITPAGACAGHGEGGGCSHL